MRFDAGALGMRPPESCASVKAADLEDAEGIRRLVKGGASPFRQLFRPVGNGESSNERSR